MMKKMPQNSPIKDEAATNHSTEPELPEGPHSIPEGGLGEGRG